MDKLLKTKDAAAQLNVTIVTVRALCRQGRLRSIRIGKRSIRVFQASIDAYVQAQANEHEQPHA